TVSGANGTISWALSAGLTINAGCTAGSTSCAVNMDSGGSRTVTVTILKALTVTGITANNRAYDGTTTATLNTGSAPLVGVNVVESVSLVTGGTTGTFSDRNVGNSKTVTISGLSLSGTDAGKYALTQPTATANIAAKALTYSGLSVTSSKVYDGTTAA